MVDSRLQEYKLILKRDTLGTWWLTGFWNTSPINQHSEWSLDGKPLSFSTRKEALEHLLSAQGIPE